MATFGVTTEPKPERIDQLLDSDLMAKLDQVEGGGLTQLQPQVGGPQADQLAEDLADLRGGDKITGGAERVAGEVITVDGIAQAAGHVASDGERTVGGDFAGQ